MIKITNEIIKKEILSFNKRYPEFPPEAVETTEKILSALVGEEIEFYNILVNNRGEILFGIGNGINPEENPKEGLTLNIFVNEWEFDIYRYDIELFVDFIGNFCDDEIEEAVECIKKQFKK